MGQSLKSGSPCTTGSAGVTERLPAEGYGGPAETDGDQQRHPEPAAVPHVEGEGGDQPRAGRPAGQRPARWVTRDVATVGHILTLVFLSSCIRICHSLSCCTSATCWVFFFLYV